MRIEWCIYIWGVVCVCMEWCICIWGLCVCIWSSVYACVCVCLCIWGDVCVCIIWLIRSFLMFLWHFSFLSEHRLILCAAVEGTAEPVPSYQAG